MKKLFAILLSFAMVLSLAACGGSSSGTSGNDGATSTPASDGATSTPASDGDTNTTAPAASGDEQTFNLKLSHGLAEDHIVQTALTDYATAVNEASNGTISIEIFPNATLGSEADNIGQIQAGALDMAKVSASTLTNFSATYNAFSVPYVFSDQEHYFNVMDSDLAESIFNSTEGDGFIALTWLDSGARSFYTKDTPIREPEDLKGLKIRTMDSQMAIDMMNALGGSSTVMSYADIYTGLQQGTIDGAENNISALHDHGEVARYYSFDEHTRIPDIVVISANIWNSMSENQREIMKSAALEMSEKYKTQWADFEDYYRNEAINDLGVTMVEDVDKEAFQAACQSIYDNLDAETSDIVQQILDMAE